MRKWGILLVGLLLVAGCSQAAPTAEESGEVLPVIAQEAGKVIAEASIVPARWSELRPPSGAGGLVVEVLVEEGDAVAEGDVLLRMDTTDAKLAVQRAEAGLAAAQARLAEVKGWPRPEEVAVTEARLEAAEAALAQAAAARDRLAAGESDSQIAAAQAELAAAMAEQRQLDRLHEQTMECFDFTLPDGSEHTICPALGRPEEQVRYALEAAEGRMGAAQSRLEAAQNQAEAGLRDARAGVSAAVAQQDALEAQLELQKAGNPEERIASAEANVDEAEIALAAAQATLERTEVRAPLDGTVAELNVKAGDTAAPGEVLIVLATLDQLRAQTKDLTELDVVDVAVGQPVLVTLDALPDMPLQGHVTRIDRQSVDYRGDVTYPIVVELDKVVPEVRWGMTALVEIEVE